MTDYLKNGNLDESRMSAEYLEAEKKYREKGSRLWDRNEQLKKDVRSKLGLTPEQRLDEYMQLYQRDISTPFAKMASDFFFQIMKPRGNDERLLSQGVGEKFSDHLIALADKPVEELSAIMQTAQRTGEKDLVRAVAQVGLDRNAFGLYNQWAASEPELAEALKRVRSTPDPEQVETRANAARPPKASPSALQPTQVDFDRAKQAEWARKHAEEQERRGFYGITRHVGRHSYRI